MVKQAAAVMVATVARPRARVEFRLIIKKRVKRTAKIKPDFYKNAKGKATD